MTTDLDLAALAAIDVHVHVNDLHRSMEFYRDGIGFAADGPFLRTGALQFAQHDVGPEIER